MAIGVGLWSWHGRCFIDGMNEKKCLVCDSELHIIAGLSTVTYYGCNNCHAQYTVVNGKILNPEQYKKILIEGGK